jgi:hypothetical protein
MEEKTASTQGTAEHAHSTCFFCARPHLFERLVPEDTHEHFRNARIEFWKAIRTLIDHQIVRLTREEAKGAHVTVE